MSVQNILNKCTIKCLKLDSHNEFRFILHSSFHSCQEGEVFFLFVVLYIPQPRAEPRLPSPKLIFIELLKAGAKATSKFLEDRNHNGRELDRNVPWSIPSYFYNGEKKPLVCCGLVERYA